MKSCIKIGLISIICLVFGLLCGFYSEQHYGYDTGYLHGKYFEPKKEFCQLPRPIQQRNSREDRAYQEIKGRSC